MTVLGALLRLGDRGAEGWDGGHDAALFSLIREPWGRWLRIAKLRPSRAGA